ncbi:MAG: GNAT family N-acetyltransferase [Candidatus Lokiarchaeota archaeon]|nr:GNAT family N-acetyltransferase [Candidatus Lokiarchaeota archaeon]
MEVICLVVIREYKAKDLDSTINLMREYSKLLGSTDFNETDTKKTIKLRTLNPKYHTLIAELDGKVVGMCYVDIERNDLTGEHEGLIKNTVTDADYQRRGIATKLVEKGLDILSHSKIDKIKVEVREEVKPAIKLFQNFGFKLVGTVMERDVITIREYNPRDFKDTVELLKIYSEEVGITFDENEWADTMSERIYNSKYRQLVALDNKEQKIVGMCFLSLYKSIAGALVGIISHAVVHPKYRNRGIGRGLLTRGVDILSILKVDKIRITIATEISQTDAFFKQVGFDKMGYLLTKKVG